jgi:hypothetical protein
MRGFDIMLIEDASPESLYMAAMLATGAQDAACDDVEAAAWLLRCSLPYLECVAPATVNPIELHVMLLNRISPLTRLQASRYSPLAAKGVPV